MIMEKKTTKYIRYLNQGLNSTSQMSEEVDSADPSRVDLLSIPKKCAAFCFYERTDIVDKNGDVILKGKNSKDSRWYYLGRRLNYDDAVILFGSEGNQVVDIMQQAGVSSVCMWNGYFLPMGNDDMTMEEYTNIHEKEKTVREMFKKIEEHRGENVFCEVWKNGVLTLEQDMLVDIDYFDNVELKKTILPFIGLGCAIAKISSLDGEVLFENPYLENYYNRCTFEGVVDAERKLYGDFIVNKRMERRIKLAGQEKKRQVDDEEKVKKQKYTLMRDGLHYIDEKLALEWLQYVDENANNKYNCTIIKKSVDGLQMLADGKSSEEVVKVCFNKDNGLMNELTASILSHFSPKGEEFSTYMKDKYNVDPNKDISFNTLIKKYPLPNKC